jgi:hypothetical protein
VHLIGEGIPHHLSTIPTDNSVELTPSELWTPRATVVAMQGFAMSQHGQFTAPMELEPIYIRLAEAEEKRLAAPVPRQSR